MTQKAWDVFLDGLWIDTVFFNSNLDEDYVRNSLICHDHYNPDITLKVQKTMNPNFICRPVKAFDENPDGSPACIEECPLDQAQWVGVYRENPDHEKTGESPSVWIFDVEITQFNTQEQALKLAEGLCELLNGLDAQEALHNPKLHVFFR